MALGELRGPMREETEQWLNRVSLGLADAARHRRGGPQPPDADEGVRSFGAAEARGAAPDLGGGRAPARGTARGRIGGTLKKRVFSLLLALAPALVLGQSYPNRPVRMIIPFAPGGASDFVGRIMQPRMTRAARPAGRDREPRRGRRQHRPGGGGQGRPRRLHHLPRQYRHDRDQRRGVPIAQHQAAARLHRRYRGRRRARRADRQPTPSRRTPCRR